MSSSPDEKSAEVHSANSWETADLGDKARNEKFLKLMGAAKKEHHGRFVIGDKEAKHVRQKKDVNHMEDELVEQYHQGMEHRLVGGRKGHIGLGFHQDMENDEQKDEDKEDDGKGESVDAAGKDESVDAAGKDESVDAAGKDESVDAAGKDESVDAAGKNESLNANDEVSDKKQESSEAKEKTENKNKRESIDESDTKHGEVKKMKFVKSSS